MFELFFIWVLFGFFSQIFIVTFLDGDHVRLKDIPAFCRFALLGPLVWFLWHKNVR